MDAFAMKLFTYGRYLTAQDYMEDASIRTVQSYALITMYLLGACRRNAAFMYLGIAVRAGYAVGLHLKEVALTFSPGEFEERERLWKVLRILDLFMSASLGRPPSTTETRDTSAEHNYSASNDLCAIFEQILTNIYSKRSVSTEALSNIGAQHRKWAARFFQGLSNDRVAPTELIDADTLPNIGLLHVKEAYYWTIILLTRPFLLESVISHVQKATNQGEGTEPCTTAFDSNNKILVHACVDSAIRTVDLLKALEGCQGLPKRLPFVINSLFIAALVLGFAYFGDLYTVFPLERHLKNAYKLLSQFKYDAIAQRNASIIGYLREACDRYMETRTAQNMDHQGRAVGIMFGQIHKMRSHGPTRAQTPSILENSNNQSSLSQAIQTDQNRVQGMNLTQAQAAMSSMADFSYTLDNIEDYTHIPYPTMAPHTIYFDAYGEDMPLFSTINTANNYYPDIT